MLSPSTAALGCACSARASRWGGMLTADPEKYVEAALRSACQCIATAPDGVKNQTLNSEAHGIGRIVGGGYLAYSRAFDELFAATKTAGIPRREAETTLKSGLTSGMKNPAELGAMRRALQRRARRSVRSPRAIGRGKSTARASRSRTRPPSAICKSSAGSRAIFRRGSGFMPG